MTSEWGSGREFAQLANGINILLDFIIHPRADVVKGRGGSLSTMYKSIRGVGRRRVVAALNDTRGTEGKGWRGNRDVNTLGVV